MRYEYRIHATYGVLTTSIHVYDGPRQDVHMHVSLFCARESKSGGVSGEFGVKDSRYAVCEGEDENEDEDEGKNEGTE